LAEFSLRNSVDLAGIGLPAARKLLDLAYNDWQSQDIIGQVTMETNDLIGAESYLRKAVELGPTQAAPYLHLGLLYLQTRKLGLAYSNFLQVQALDPDGPFGWQASRMLKQYFP
jgi:predicted Zn-dependent protease